MRESGLPEDIVEVVLFYRWDGCILFSGVYLMYNQFLNPTARGMGFVHSESNLSVCFLAFPLLN